jgi:hypothetical protein
VRTHIFVLAHLPVQDCSLVVLHRVNEEAIVAEGGQYARQQPRQPVVQHIQVMGKVVVDTVNKQIYIS